MAPAASSCPRPQDSPCAGPTAPCSRADGRGVLEEAAFAERPELLLSTKPKLEDQDHDPAGACTPCVYARRSPGQNALGLSLWLLKSSQVRGMSQSLSDITGVPGATHHWPSSQEGRCPKKGKPALQDVWYLLTALQAGFNLGLIRSCDEKLVPCAQGPGNGQPNNAGGGALVTSSVPTERPDLAPPMAVKGEGNIPCRQRESPSDDRVVEVGRDIWRSPCPTPLLKQAHLEHVAQDNMRRA